MSDSKIVGFLPDLMKNIPSDDNKFLFVFPPEMVGDKILFGLSFKTGVQIFSLIILVKSIFSFFEIFTPPSFWLLLVAIISFLFYLIIALYAFSDTVSMLLFSFSLFLFFIGTIIFAGILFVC